MNNLDIVVEQSLAVITTNFTDVKGNLARITEAYEGLTYTDDIMAEARADVATLRKIKKAIDDKRKEVKKAHAIPYEEFEKQCKELTGMIDSVIEPINWQIEDYTKRKQELKREKVKELYDEIVPSEVADIVSFEKIIFGTKWISNTSYSMTKIKEEIMKIVEKVLSDLSTMKDTCEMLDVEEEFSKCVEIYKEDGMSLTLVLAHIKEYAKIKDELEKKKAEELAKEKEKLVKESNESVVNTTNLENELAQDEPKLAEEDDLPWAVETEDESNAEEVAPFIVLSDFERDYLEKIHNKVKLSESELRELVCNSIEDIYGENRRWCRGVTSIIQLGDEFYALNWDQGLTECQENSYYEQPYRVEQRTYEKTITVTEWVRVEEE